MTAAVELVRVTKDFGRVRAVEAVSLTIPEGALFGLIGPNGAGKTTTFGLLSGFLHPTSGEIRIRGLLLRPGHPPVGRVLALPQDASLPDRMRVVDVLVMLGRLAGLTKGEARARASRALERVGLLDLEARRIGALSHGERRRVGIAQTLLGETEVILLDEPTAGLDARSAAELRALIRQLHADRTIILSSHNLQEVETLCDHAAILNRGSIAASGSMDEIKSTSSLVHIAFFRALAGAERVLASLRTMRGVRSATVRADALGIDLELEAVEEGARDEVMNQLLKVLLESGASVREIERGKSLEQTFLEATNGAPGGLD